MKTIIRYTLVSVLIIIGMQVSAQTNPIADYLWLKDAFVQSDVEAAKAAAENLSKSLKSKDLPTSIIKASNSIATSNDLAAQRVAFKIVTDELIKEVKSSGTDQLLYVQYCPMAFNNSGASWLSNSEDILNPYFGDMMLKCGSVKEELKQ